MRLLFFIISVFGWVVLRAQPATIRFTNELKTNVVVTKVTDIQLFTQTSVYALNQIRSVSFWEAEPDSVSLYTLRSNGVTVYLKSKRLGPIEAPKEYTEYTSNGSFGFGLGLEYGGLGTKLTLLTDKPVGLFAGLGYNLNELGYNVGLDFKFTPRRSATAYLTAMYGYNAVIVGGENEKTYYGFSVGMGVKLVGKYRQKNYTSLAFLVPFRDKEFIEYGKLTKQFVFPVLFSIGYNLGF